MTNPLTDGLKRTAEQILPSPYRSMQRMWRCQKERRFQAKLDRVCEGIVKRWGWQVLSGPFAGMKYVEKAVDSALAPKLVGSYEAELFDVIEGVVQHGYSRIINIGCAEGYYAVGLARRLPETLVYAFDTNPSSQRLCSRLASLNGVADRVHVHGACDIQCLGRLPLEGVFLLCDVEGYELELLRPDAIPALARCDLLIELHDCLREQVTPTILSRFSGTHEACLISSTARDPSNYDKIQFLGLWEQRLAVDELRTSQQWVFLKSTALGISGSAGRSGGA